MAAEISDGIVSDCTNSLPLIYLSIDRLLPTCVVKTLLVCLFEVMSHSHGLVCGKGYRVSSSSSAPFASGYRPFEQLIS